MARGSYLLTSFQPLWWTRAQASISSSHSHLGSLAATSGRLDEVVRVADSEVSPVAIQSDHARGALSRVSSARRLLSRRSLIHCQLTTPLSAERSSRRMLYS